MKQKQLPVPTRTIPSDPQTLRNGMQKQREEEFATKGHEQIYEPVVHKNIRETAKSLKTVCFQNASFSMLKRALHSAIPGRPSNSLCPLYRDQNDANPLDTQVLIESFSSMRIRKSEW